MNKNKHFESNQLKDVADMANIFFIRQKETLGLGHAIKLAKSFVNNEPFAVLLGDDIVLNKNNNKTALRQCIDSFSRTNSTILGVQRIDINDSYKYGMVSIENKKTKSRNHDNLFLINGIIEKPTPSESPSAYAVMGRYIFKPSIFNYLEKVNFDANGEIQITDAIKGMIKDDKIYAKVFQGKRYDLGSKEGYLKANIDVGVNEFKLDKILENHFNSLMKNK